MSSKDKDQPVLRVTQIFFSWLSFKVHFNFQAFGLVMGALCGLHLPAMSLLITYVFDAFEKDGSTMIRLLCNALAMYCGVGVALLLTQFASVIYYSVLTVTIVGDLSQERCRMFRMTATNLDRSTN